MTVEDRKAIVISVGFIAVWLTLVGGMIYVAAHFITKFW